MYIYMCVYIVQSLHFKTKEYYDFKLITHAFIIIFYVSFTYLTSSTKITKTKTAIKYADIKKEKNTHPPPPPKNTKCNQNQDEKGKYKN